MENLTLKDLQTKHVIVDLVIKTKVHELLKDTVSVYYTDILYDGKETCFYLFLNDKYLRNAVTFPSRISQEDIVNIAKDMIEQYRNSCDLEELDIELKGEVPCKEFKGKYSNCEDCHEHMNNEKGGCMGVTYTLSESFDSYTFKRVTFKDKWYAKYGEGSESHKKFVIDKTCDQLREFSYVCKDSKYLEEIIESLLHYCDEDKVKEIFNDLSK